MVCLEALKRSQCGQHKVGQLQNRKVLADNNQKERSLRIQASFRINSNSANPKKHYLEHFRF